MRMGEVVCCGLIASAVDLDHFAAARSLRIQVQQAYVLLCHKDVLASVGLKLLFYLEGV
jgi:hypothetical protein